MNDLRENSENRIILIILSISSFLTAFSVYTTVISVKSIGSELDMDLVALNWINNIFILATAMFQLFFGKIGDQYGRKKVFLGGVALFTFSSIVLAISPTSGIFIAFRFIQGTGSALIFATVYAILTATFPKNKRGKVIGINVTAIYIGLTLSPLLGGVMTEYIGWRSQFLLSIPIGIIIMLLILFRVKREWTSNKKERIDYLGFIIYASFLFFLIYAITLFPNSGAFLFIIFSGIGVIIFYLWEKRVTNPLLDLNLFRFNRYFSFSCLVSIFYYISIMAITLILSFFLQYFYGFEATQTGFILFVSPLMQAIFSPFIGRLSDKVESRKLVSLGIIIAIVSFFILIFINHDFPIYLVFIAFGILGLGTAFFSSPNTRAIMSSIPKSYLGVASGLEGTMRSIGQSLSFGIWTLISGIIIGNVVITPLYYPEFLFSARLCFIIFLILIIISFLFSIFRGTNKIKS